jgi:hypothetical protein
MAVGRARLRAQAAGGAWLWRHGVARGIALFFGLFSWLRPR